MTRPLRSTPLQGLPRYYGPVRQRAAKTRQRAFPCSMREPQTRLMPPLCRTPPGQSSGTRQVLLPQPGAWPRFRCPLVNVTTRQQRFGFTHLPGPHLTPLSAPFPHRSPRRSSTNAACGGLKPPPQGRLRRAYLHLSHSTDSRRSHLPPHQDLRSSFMAHAPAFSRYETYVRIIVDDLAAP